MQRFDEYMEEALYGANGFYSSGRGRAGRRGGDFITSPEVGPLFGALIARWLDRQWHAMGQPDTFRVIDLGTGPGTLVKAIDRAQTECSAAMQIGGADIDGHLPDDITGCVVIANELLDNIPFQWLRQTERLETAWIDRGQITWKPVDAPVPKIEADGEFPWLQQAASLLQNLLDRGASRVLAIDYGTATTAELAKRGDWLRCYRGHQRGDDPLHEPGLWDITTDVPVDQLPAPTTVRTQAEFLDELGIDDLVSEGRSHWDAHASNPDLKAFEMRSRTNEAPALTDPSGLGGFLAIEWHRD